MDNQQELNEELRQRTELALIHAWNLGLSADDLALLSWHAGIDYHQFITEELKCG